MNKPLAITPEEMRAVYRNDLSSFIQFSFGELYPNTPYFHNWHIDVIADKLTQCYEGKIKRLIINLPPRMMKSTCASIAFPAWVLLNKPHANLMCVSYSDELVKEFGSLSRKLMTTPRFKRFFPESAISKRQNTASHLKLVSGGSRLGISAGGSLTGRGADIIIIDDPLKASDLNTKERSHINQWFDENIYQRLNNKNDGVIIVVMQRLHEDDLTAHLLAQSDEWELLELKAIADDDESFQLSESVGGTMFHRDKDGALHPERESREQLDKVKRNLGGYVFASQYQQNPAADKESLIRAEWFNEYDSGILDTFNQPYWLRHIRFNQVIQSWDTAMKAEETSDYTACVTLGIKDDKYYVLDVYREKLRFSEIIEKVKEHKSRFQADLVIIEDSPAGIHVIQALRDDHIPISTQRPIGDKYMRLSAVSGQIESGFVLLPDDALWLDDFLLEITRFPNVRNDDQVDAFTQAMKAALDQAQESLWYM